MGVEESVGDSANALSEAQSKAAWEEETPFKEDENYQPREKRTQRDKPKGRKSIGEMHSTP